jgi:hypothetical protein
MWLAMMLGHIVADKVDIATLWLGVGGGTGCNGNSSSSLYGWQDFGTYELVTFNSYYSYKWCNYNATGYYVPEATVLPSGNAWILATKAFNNGEHLLNMSGSMTNVVAYSATKGTGATFLLINLSKTTPAVVTLSLANATTICSTANGNCAGTQYTYGKMQYDNSMFNIWTSYTTSSLGTVSAPSGFTVTLPVWSVNAITLQ